MTHATALDPVRLDRLSRQCKALSREVDALGAELFALSVTAAGATPEGSAAPAVSASAAVTPPVAAAATPAPVAVPAATAGVPHTSPRPSAPAASRASAPAAAPATGQATIPGMPPPPPAAPGLVPPKPSASVPRETWVSRALAISGVAVTLAGVVMLLVLAARAGLLRPEVRVAMGAALSIGLVAAARFVHKRPGGMVGATALAATGFAAAFLDVVAVTVIYDWVPTIVGLLLAGLVAAGGVALAMRWLTRALAVIVLVASALTAPILTHGVTLTLVLFFIVLQVAGAIPEMLRGWSIVALIRTSPVTLALMTLIAYEAGVFNWPTGPSLTVAASTIAAATAVAIFGLAIAVWGVTVQSQPDRTVLAGTLATVPMLYTTTVVRPVMGIFLGLALALACWSALLVLRPRSTQVQAALGSVGGIALLLAAIAVPDHATAPALPVLVSALVSGALALRMPSRIVRWYAAAYAAIGAFMVLLDIDIAPLTSFDQAPYRLGYRELIAGLLLLAVAVVITLMVIRTTEGHEVRMVALAATAAVGLYAVTIVCIALPMSLQGGRTGFWVGQLAATTVWIAVGCVALLLGLSRPAYSHLLLVVGLTVVGAALVKLFTYDLATLGGFTRAATFLVVGLVLLVAGTRYARAFADRERAVEATPEAGDPAAISG